MLTFIPIYIAIFALFGSSILTALSAAFTHKGRFLAEEILKKKKSSFRHFLQFFFGARKWEGLLFTLSFTKHVLRLIYLFTAFLFLMQLLSHPYVWLMVLSIIIVSLIVDFVFSLVGQVAPETTFNFLLPIGACFWLLCLPLTLLFFQLMKCFLPKKAPSKISPLFKIRDKVFELLQETELGAYLDPTEKKFILSIVSFKERIVREVMVPRINIFRIADETPVHEAAKQFLVEGYSRIPVYKDSIDNIIGVLLYKDVLKIYIEQFENPHLLNSPIRTLMKPVLYTPETKKIAHLLQEFRSKQIHLAIVVDEWGGTEGIVTIEDILEELVGEIADEYDIENQTPFSTLPGGGWVVDAKMSIIDIREELGVDIPLSAEYDTIGGYIFHRAGAIPSKGWKIHHDDFDLEVLTSTERALSKIKILPH